MKLKVVYLKPRKEESLLRQHPWLFSGAIKRMEGQPKTGDLVQVCANKGRVLGYGHYSQNTSIAVRMLSFEKEFQIEAWFENQIARAIELRMSLGLFEDDNSICRLIHAEGDGMSGLIVDYYDRVAVVQTHSLGMHLSLHLIILGLKAALPTLEGIYDKSARVLRKSGLKDQEDGFVFGELPKSWNPTEQGRKFYVDLEHGQKTGFFIDQRDNRTLLQSMAAGKRVLNVFSYTGGFSIAAMQGGASHAASLDCSRRALDIAEKAIRLNDFESSTHRSIEADALSYLKNGVSKYDIVVLDPPAFAKSASARHAAVQGYKRINQRTLETIQPGGILFTFSCSQAVDDRLFTHTVIAAAINAKRNVRILHRLHQPPDHPVSAFHPEGSYLKGLVLRVD